jgi:glycosyltransferase involved in cell wall biosynthesis
MSKEYSLSILIPTLNSRSESFCSLYNDLQYQIQSKPVQILGLTDNKSFSVGEKRNLLINMSSGRYVCFIDDDDRVSEEYIDSILEAIDADKKVITFKGTQNTNGLKDAPFTYDPNIGRNLKKEINGVRYKVMLPDHLCVWKKDEIVFKFPHKNLSEDHEWARSMGSSYNSDDVHHIDKFLYHYEFNKQNSECRK